MYLLFLKIVKAKTILVLYIVFFVFALYSCDSTYYPKPRGYFRIDLPEKKYKTFDTTYPFRFDYPNYAKVIKDIDPHAEPYWINVDFPRFKARVHLSYKPVKNNLNIYLEDSRSFVMKHIPKASDIREKIIINDETKVFGLLYDIKGTDAASVTQFYLTDSTKNFVRGALYFNVAPNNDSLAPVISFINKDIEKMIDSFRWKDY